MYFKLCVILKLCVVIIERSQAYDKGKLLDYDHTDIWWKGWKATTTRARTTMHDYSKDEKLQAQLVAWNPKLALVDDLTGSNKDHGENILDQPMGMPGSFPGAMRGDMPGGMFGEIPGGPRGVPAFRRNDQGMQNNMHKGIIKGLPSKDVFYGPEAYGELPPGDMPGRIRTDPREQMPGMNSMLPGMSPRGQIPPAMKPGGGMLGMYSMPPGMVPAGRVPGGLPPRMPPGGRIARGMPPGMGPGGRILEDMPPGVGPGERMPEELPTGMAPGGQMPGGLPPGMGPGGQMPGSMPPGITPGGRIPEGMPPGMAPGGMPPGMGSGGRMPGGTPPGMGSGGRMPGDIPPGMAPGGRMPGGMPPRIGQGGRMPEGMPPGMGPGGRMPGRVPPGMAPRGRMPQGMPPGMGPGGQMPEGMPPGMGPGGRMPGGMPPGMAPRGRMPQGMPPGMPPGGRIPGGMPSGMPPGGTPSELQIIGDSHSGAGEEHDSNEYAYEGHDYYMNAPRPNRPQITKSYQETAAGFGDQMTEANNNLNVVPSLNPSQMARIREVYNYNANILNQGSDNHPTLKPMPSEITIQTETQPAESMFETKQTLGYETETTKLTKTDTTHTIFETKQTTQDNVNKTESTNHVDTPTAQTSVEPKTTTSAYTFPLVVNPNEFPGYPDNILQNERNEENVTVPRPIIDPSELASINENEVLFPPGRSSWFFGYPDSSNGSSEIPNIKTVNTTGRPLAKKLNDDIDVTGVGMFSVFMKTALEIISKKDEEIRLVAVALLDNFERIQKEGRMMSMNNEILTSIYSGFKIITTGPIETLQQKAFLAYHLIMKRKTMLGKELNVMLDLIDMKITADDGDDMLMILEDLESFTKDSGNDYTLAANFVENVIMKIAGRFNEDDKKTWVNAMKALHEKNRVTIERRQRSIRNLRHNNSTDAGDIVSKVSKNQIKGHIAARRLNFMKEKSVHVIKGPTVTSTRLSSKYSKSFRKLRRTQKNNLKTKNKTTNVNINSLKKSKIRKHMTFITSTNGNRQKKLDSVHQDNITTDKIAKHCGKHYSAAKHRKKKTVQENKVFGHKIHKLHDKNSDRKLKRKLFKHLKKKHRKTYRILKRRLKHRLKKLKALKTGNKKYSLTEMTVNMRKLTKSMYSYNTKLENSLKNMKQVSKGSIISLKRTSGIPKYLARAHAQEFIQDSGQIPIFPSSESATFGDLSSSCSKTKASKSTLKTNNLLAWITAVSSESDEEMILRSNLRDALVGGARRASGGGLPDVSISTDNEPLLKMNIYKALRFNH